MEEESPGVAAAARGERAHLMTFEQDFSPCFSFEQERGLLLRFGH